MLEIDKKEKKKLKEVLKENLSFGLNDGDFEAFQIDAGDVLTEKKFNEEVEMVKNLLEKLIKC